MGENFKTQNVPKRPCLSTTKAQREFLHPPLWASGFSQWRHIGLHLSLM